MKKVRVGGAWGEQQRYFPDTGAAQYNLYELMTLISVSITICGGSCLNSYLSHVRASICATSPLRISQRGRIAAFD